MAAGGQGDYLNTQILNWMKGATFAAAPATVYVALLTTAPTSDIAAFASSGAVEVSGGSYARVAITTTTQWSAISGGATVAQQISNSVILTFPTPTANWGTVLAIALTDSATLNAGNLLYSAAITSQVINTGVIASFAIGQLIVTAD